LVQLMNPLSEICSTCATNCNPEGKKNNQQLFGHQTRVQFKNLQLSGLARAQKLLTKKLPTKRMCRKRLISQIVARLRRQRLRKPKRNTHLIRARLWTSMT